MRPLAWVALLLAQAPAAQVPVRLVVPFEHSTYFGPNLT